jgi:ABC-type Mn2+/Zn2+ transport system permease subunit
MDSSFGFLDAFAFVVFAILIAVGVIIIVSLGQLPGQLARKWGHPQAAAINATSWLGIATGGLLWPVAFIWAFMTPITRPAAGPGDDQQPPSPEGNLAARKETR